MEIRSQLPQNERISAENKVFELLTLLPEFNNAKTISSFVSFRDEIAMDQINSYILSSGKKLLLPYINTTTKVMTFHEVNTLSELVLNSFGILEPNPLIHVQHDNESTECILTPGVAFDSRGYRLGYGGGFYDRLFSQIKKTIPKIGIAFDLQRIDDLPVESFDYPIHKLITEKGLFTF